MVCAVDPRSGHGRADDHRPAHSDDRGTVAARVYATTAFTAASKAPSMLPARFGLNRGFQSYFDDLTDPQIGADRKQRSRNGRCIADLSIQ